MKLAPLSRALLLLTVLGFALPAVAQPGPGGGRHLRERQGDMRRPLPPRRDDADAQRKGDDVQHKGDDRASEEDRRRSLTPEQRRELRRDIGAAGREIYRPQRRQMPDKPRRFNPREN